MTANRMRVGIGQFNEMTDEILRFAESESVDLIFMATQGVDTFREVVAGRTTERVMRRAPCPVCVVPEG